MTKKKREEMLNTAHQFQLTAEQAAILGNLVKALPHSGDEEIPFRTRLDMATCTKPSKYRLEEVLEMLITPKEMRAMASVVLADDAFGGRAKSDLLVNCLKFLSEYDPDQPGLGV